MLRPYCSEARLIHPYARPTQVCLERPLDVLPGLDNQRLRESEVGASDRIAQQLDLPRQTEQAWRQVEDLGRRSRDGSHAGALPVVDGVDRDIQEIVIG